MVQSIFCELAGTARRRTGAAEAALPFDVAQALRPIVAAFGTFAIKRSRTVRSAFERQTRPDSSGGMRHRVAYAVVFRRTLGFLAVG